MSDHPETPSAPPPPAVVTLTASARSVVADLDDLARRLPGDDPAVTARIIDKLAEELAEVGLMLRALPGRPAPMSGHDCALLMALRAAHAAGEDVAETIARACARLAGELGSSAAVLSNRSGSWEAGHLRGLLAGTLGEDDEALRASGGPGGSL